MKPMKPTIFPYGFIHPPGVPTPGHASNAGVFYMAQRRPKPRRLRRTPGGDARVCGHYKSGKPGAGWDGMILYTL